MNDAVNKLQLEFWNTDAGQRWVTQQEFMDRLLAPVLDRLLGSVSIAVGDHVLDIGCGTGASVLELAQRVGPDGAIQGCDISEAMLDLAGQRVADAGIKNAELILADAQIHGFTAAQFDHVVSRFGVMFFDDPQAAFSNISSALRSGGQITMMAWAPAANNPWFKITHDATLARLGPVDAIPDPHAPGPMGFQDAEWVQSMLKSAGFDDVSAASVGVELDAGPSLSKAAQTAMTLGPAVRLLDEKNATEADAKVITSRVQMEFAEYQTPNGMRVPADLLLFQATKK